MTLDDLWDWERWGPSAIARRFMEPDEIDTFGSSIEDFLRLTNTHVARLPENHRISLSEVGGSVYPRVCGAMAFVIYKEETRHEKTTV